MANRRKMHPDLVGAAGHRHTGCKAKAVFFLYNTPLPDGIRVEMPLQLRTVTVESPLPPDMEALFS